MKGSLAQVCSAGTSLVCMAQMGAAAAAGGAAMAAMGAATAGSVPLITLVFQAIGLGFVLALPAGIFQAMLVAILGFTMVTSFLSYRRHGRRALLGLTALSSALLYTSIYVFISEPLYWIAFALMLLSAAWSYTIERRKRLRLMQER